MGQYLAFLCPDPNDDGPPKPGPDPEPEPEPEYKHNTIEDLKKQKYEDIRKKLEAENSNFEDPLFPKTKSSIGPSRTSYHENIKWMRAQDIASNPVFVTDGTTRFDIEQGKLGDCWFLAALANLPAHPEVFKKVMDKKQTFNNNPGN